jgi:hypothetical protein
MSLAETMLAPSGGSILTLSVVGRIVTWFVNVIR